MEFFEVLYDDLAEDENKILEEDETTEETDQNRDFIDFYKFYNRNNTSAIGRNWSGYSLTGFARSMS